MVDGHPVQLVTDGGVHNDWNHGTVEGVREGDGVDVEDQYRPGIGDVVDDCSGQGGRGGLAEVGGARGKWEGEVSVSESGGGVEAEREGVSGGNGEEGKKK